MATGKGAVSETASESGSGRSADDGLNRINTTRARVQIMIILLLTTLAEKKGIKHLYVDHSELSGYLGGA